MFISFQTTIHGKCPSYYSTVTHEDTSNMTVTQVVDIAGCREKAEIYSGMAAAVLDNVVKQVCLHRCITFCIYESNRPNVSAAFVCVAQNPERRICGFNSEIRLHSQTRTGRRRHYLGARRGGTGLQPLQREGWHFQHESDVRQENKHLHIMLLSKLVCNKNHPALKKINKSSPAGRA